MSRQKIDYGIDLGTTNSAIARMDDGEVRILKSDDFQADTTPSCVHFNKKHHVFRGQKAANQLAEEASRLLLEFDPKRVLEGYNTFEEFKRTMGSDWKEYCPNIQRFVNSEELSSEVLKKLKSYVRNENQPSSIVITVPAKFRQNQLDATQRAAGMAGFQHCELLPEPIAASISYGLDANSATGYWLVFDFGGGTFDAALMQVEEGIIRVADTEGNNHLGGRDIDNAIVNHIFMPWLEQNYQLRNEDLWKNALRKALKKTGEEVKTELSGKSETVVFKENIAFDELGEEIILDMEINLSQFESVAVPIFQKAIDLSLELLSRNGLSGGDLTTLLPVGGPTFSQTLRRMLRDQITDRIDTSVDPMTAVAKGAALFASTRDMPLNLKTQDKSKVQLALRYAEMTVETEEFLGIKVEKSQTDGRVFGGLFAEVTRSDNAWGSGKVEIPPEGEIIALLLNEGKANGFKIDIFDEQGNLCLCEPSNFTVLQGLRAPYATLPYNIGVEVHDSITGKSGFTTIAGLKRNQTLPAKGIGSYRTQTTLRPGNENDVINIPLLEGGHGSDGTRAILNELVGLVVITGKDISAMLPADSQVDLTISIDSGRRINVSVYFPYLDETIEVKLPENLQPEYDAVKLETEISLVCEALERVEKGASTKNGNGIEKLKNELNYLEDLLKSGKGDYNTKTQVKEGLREIWKSTDKIEEAFKWPRIEKELLEAMSLLEEAQQAWGTENTAEMVQQTQHQTHSVLNSMNVNLAKTLTEEINSLVFAIRWDNEDFLGSLLKHYDENFNSFSWKNHTTSREKIKRGISLYNEYAPKGNIQACIHEVWGELPDGEQQSLPGNMNTTLLRK